MENNAGGKPVSYLGSSTLFSPMPHEIHAGVSSLDDFTEINLSNTDEGTEAGASPTSPSSESSALQTITSEGHKTLLENYGYNAFMTLFQDLPQSIVTVYIMSHGGLKNTPDNPTGVSLPGYLNLIPQFGNTAAGLAAAHEAVRLIKLCQHNQTANHVLNAALYAIFSLSTITNGVTNTVTILSAEHDETADFVSNASTYIALLSNLLILFREEIQLIRNLCFETRHDEKHREKQFHLVCSLNLNISIITALLVTTGNISLTEAAIGYLVGTWLGQMPELIEPTIERVNYFCG